MFRITSKISDSGKSVIKTKNTISVRIPAVQETLFPTKCVVCSKQSADTTVVGIDPIHTYKTFYLFGQEFGAPIHEGCKKKLNKSKYIKYTLLAVSLFIFLYFTLEFSKGIILALVMPYLIIYIFWEANNPPPYGVTKLGDKIEHTFTNQEYGYEFAEINGIKE